MDRHRRSVIDQSPASPRISSISIVSPSVPPLPIAISENDATRQGRRPPVLISSAFTLPLPPLPAVPSAIPAVFPLPTLVARLVSPGRLHLFLSLMTVLPRRAALLRRRVFAFAARVGIRRAGTSVAVVGMTLFSLPEEKKELFSSAYF